MDGAELNFWHHMTPRRVNYFSVSWGLGARYLLLAEKFKMAFRRGANKSDYKIATSNQLIGLQAGLVFEWNPTKRVTWGGCVKFAGFGNQAKQTSFLFDKNNTVTLRHFDQSGLHGAYLGDFTAYGQYHIGSWFNIDAGVQYIQIGRIALAPEQIGFGTGTHSGDRLAISGIPNFYGFWFGISAEF
jgi:hypothetical protein